MIGSARRERGLRIALVLPLTLILGGLGACGCAIRDAPGSGVWTRSQSPSSAVPESATQNTATSRGILIRTQATGGFAVPPLADTPSLTLYTDGTLVTAQPDQTLSVRRLSDGATRSLVAALAAVPQLVESPRETRPMPDSVATLITGGPTADLPTYQHTYDDGPAGAALAEIATELRRPESPWLAGTTPEAFTEALVAIRTGAPTTSAETHEWPSQAGPLSGLKDGACTVADLGPATAEIGTRARSGLWQSSDTARYLWTVLRLPDQTDCHN